MFAAGAPAMELGALAVQRTDVIDDMRDGEFLAVGAFAHERVVHIDVYEERFVHLKMYRRFGGFRPCGGAEQIHLGPADRIQCMGRNQFISLRNGQQG